MTHPEHPNQASRLAGFDHGVSKAGEYDGDQTH